MDETTGRASAPAIVAYAGGAAAHSAAAAERLCPSEFELVAVPSFVEVVRAAVEREAAYGVLPIESSLVGPIAETHDLLWDSPLSIVAETAIPIRHLLVARTHIPLDRVRITVACDVTNPLFGNRGAARVFGPQKGATPQQVQELDDLLRDAGKGPAAG